VKSAGLQDENSRSALPNLNSEISTADGAGARKLHVEVQLLTMLQLPIHAQSESVQIHPDSRTLPVAEALDEPHYQPLGQANPQCIFKAQIPSELCAGLQPA